MLTFAYYLLKVFLCSGILFGYYCLALRNKKFHRYNRFYLLASIVLSWIIPLIKIGFWEETSNQPTVVNLLAVVAKGDRFVEETNHFNWDWNIAVIFIFVFISSMFLAQLVVTVVKIKRLINSNPTKKWNDISFVFTNAKGTPFSFFKYIFWNEQIDLNSAEGKQILKHELTHVHENHTADKVLLNIVLIVGWSNPFLWLLRKELYMIHEFIADKKAVNEGDVHSFAKMLLKTTYPQYSFPLTNSFFYSPVKRRLLMLTSSKKTSFTYVRRVAILPLLMFTCVLFAFTLKKKEIAADSPFATIEKRAGIFLHTDELGKTEAGGGEFQDTTKKK